MTSTSTSSSISVSSAFKVDHSIQRQIRRDFIKFSIYWIALVSTCLVAFLISASYMRVEPLQFQAPIISSFDVFTPDVSLTAEAISVDPLARTIVMNWYPELTSLDCSKNDSIITDIYLSRMLLDSSSPSWSSQLQDQATFRLNGTEICLGLNPPFPSFRTVTKLISSKQYVRVKQIAQQSTFQSYPFDVYAAPFSFYTQNVETGAITALKVSDSFGIAVNFKISLLYTIVSYNRAQQNLQFYLKIERSTATKMFVVMVAVTNWLTATAFLTICAATIVYRKPHTIYAEMFVVPVGALFAFTSVRANLPGAPVGFGATIDLFTILPVLIIMSLCIASQSFTLLLVILYRRIRQEST
ncbi:hypothetical protein GALMADRAFT_159048, partial [Galerina marginata CBS 339.88]